MLIAPGGSRAANSLWRANVEDHCVTLFDNLLASATSTSLMASELPLLHPLSRSAAPATGASQAGSLFAGPFVDPIMIPLGVCRATDRSGVRGRGVLAGDRGSRATDPIDEPQPVTDRWPDQQCERDRSDANRAAEGPSGREDADLDQGPNSSDGGAGSLVDTGHPTVPRARAEPAGEIEAAAEPDQSDATEHFGHLPADGIGLGKQRCRDSQGQGDDDGVAEGAEAGAFTKWDPQQQDNQTDQEGGPADADAGLLVDAFGQDRPGADSELGVDEECFASAENPEADDQDDQRRRGCLPPGCGTPPRDRHGSGWRKPAPKGGEHAGNPMKRYWYAAVRPAARWAHAT